VVTTDTARGAEKVNEERKRKGLSPLAVHMVELVGSKVSAGGVVVGGVNEADKLSSSSIRKSMLGEYRTPKVDECMTYDPQSGPFLIGLTGAMATGKSSVASRLVKKGAYLIDCDKLGHVTYRVGGPAYDRIVSEFGEGVRGEGGEINRKALGAIVFADKSKLDLLNSIVWPEIWRLVEVKVHEAGSDSYTVCVIDAAVLVMAGWHRRVHQIWTTLCPHSELVHRVMERNGVPEEVASRRLAAQPPNQVYVDHAHIVIGTQWEPEVTGGQVEKAWLQLMKKLSSSS
jgi:phosphopantetheine adenylyltransferase/dephospho-CoA kinase